MTISISIFQDNEKIYELDPNLVSSKTDNTLYLHINNDIEYGLFEDIIDSYYLDSQIKDDCMCDQNCYTRTQHKQQDQTFTPCTHAYDHITQHIDNLEDPIQQQTVYTNEVDASLFTTDTTIPCDYNISMDILNSDKHQENKINTTQQWEFIPKANINTEMFSAILTSNIIISIMVMHSLSKTNIQHLLQQELQNPYSCLYLPKWT